MHILFIKKGIINKYKLHFSIMIYTYFKFAMLIPASARFETRLQVMDQTNVNISQEVVKQVLIIYGPAMYVNLFLNN